MAYSSLPTLPVGSPLRASYVANLDANLDDHEARLVVEEAATTDHEGRIVTLEAGGGTGDVVGPASATDNAIVRFDSTTGELVQNSGITIADGASGTLAGSNSGDVTLAGTPDYHHDCRTGDHARSGRPRDRCHRESRRHASR